MTTTLLDAVAALTAADDFLIQECLELPRRVERKRPIPDAYLKGQIGRWLQQSYASNGQLWNHQSLALQAYADGHNVTLCTDTASGKSLVFQSIALEELSRDPDARFAAFYPSKALANDQLLSWEAAAAATGFAPTTVTMIHGGVPVNDRLALLAQSRVVLMTPDICHTWLLANVANAEIRTYLRSLRTVFIDEAHEFTGVMGSNSALMLRRLIVARRCALHDSRNALRFIAASATIANPSQHVQALTGIDSIVIGPEEDGSPNHHKTLMHLGSEDPYSTAVELLRRILEQTSSETFIAFVDSRQGAERIAHELDDPRVKAYRSGYQSTERTEIENALRKGTLRGVISTSALELGVNIPHFTFGCTIGLPTTRKSLRQRIGRVGRSAPGAFAIIADPFLFTRLGGTMRDYWNGSIEPSYLYVDNRFIQFINARCLAIELDSVGRGTMSLPAVDWPADFPRIYGMTKRDAVIPEEFAVVDQLGGDDPHRSYGLRGSGEVRFLLQSSGSEIGEIPRSQAIREAYPGAIYLHNGMPFRVADWRSTVFENKIALFKTHPGSTKPKQRTTITAAVDSVNIVDSHCRASNDTFIAECHLKLTDHVEGYVEHGHTYLYSESGGKYRSRRRQFDSTGVLIRIEDPFFKNARVRRGFAELLRDVLAREHSIAPQDVQFSATNIRILQNGKPTPVYDAIVIYDNVNGSLRLSEPAFTQIEELIAKLVAGIDQLEQSGQEPLVASSFARQVLATIAGTSTAESPAALSLHDEGLLEAFRPGTIVGHTVNGGGRRVRVVDLFPMVTQNEVSLSYLVRDEHDQQYVVPAAEVCESNGESKTGMYNPESRQFINEDAEMES